MRRVVKSLAISAVATVWLAGSTLPAQAASFTDVSTNHTHKEAIDRLTERGLINGYENGTFRPENSITRGQVSKIFARYLPGDGKMQQVFADVPANGQDSELVTAAYEMKEKGIFTGSNGELKWKNNITRQQMAKVLVETFKLERVSGATSKVTDLHEAFDDEYRRYITILSENGITNVEKFNPKGNVTRGQFASFVDRAINKGSVKPNTNPSYQQINALLTEAALKENIPPEVVKAVATQESGKWTQFNSDGTPVASDDGGIGIMQITNHPGYDEQKLKTDIQYNIEAGIAILNEKYNSTSLPKVTGASRDDMESWYFAVMAYNGIKPVNSPTEQLTGNKNTKAYQEQVFARILQDSLWGNRTFADFGFTPADFDYDRNSTESIKFVKKAYTLSQPMNKTTYKFKKGDEVTVTASEVNVRKEATTESQAVGKLASGTKLTIAGPFVYEKNEQKENKFVWYPVRTSDNKVVGYIASSYLK
ncbi:S-layer homology domain-containing protein [Bacillus sp. CGMCC 1.16541]|uniref:S-layer homology domain-containing protein n=1 Tax=Bacillus sp. CGMCC 1.16541 TaxID=2185143 RepID=UPI000D73FF3F|nr:S-layer homology domain-containing protein [Bacillus sp. CGMCC 1.16541]